MASPAERVPCHAQCAPTTHARASDLVNSEQLSPCERNSGRPSSLLPTATMRNTPLGSGRCSALASDYGAVSNVSTSSGVVRIAGMAFMWMELTTSLGSHVGKAKRSAEIGPSLILRTLFHCGTQISATKASGRSIPKANQMSLFCLPLRFRGVKLGKAVERQVPSRGLGEFADTVTMADDRYEVVGPNLDLRLKVADALADLERLDDGAERLNVGGDAIEVAHPVPESRSGLVAVRTDSGEPRTRHNPSRIVRYCSVVLSHPQRTHAQHRLATLRSPRAFSSAGELHVR